MVTINNNNLVLSVSKRPGHQEMAYFRENLRLNPVILNEIGRKSFHPEIEEYEDTIFLAIQLPVFSHKDQMINASGLYFIIEKSRVTIIQHENFPVFDEMIDLLQRDKDTVESFFQYDPMFLTYKILNFLLNDLLEHLDNIIKEVGGLEKRLFSDRHDRFVRDITTVRQRTSELLRVFRPTREVLSEFRKHIQSDNVPADFQVYLRKLDMIGERIINILESQKDSLQLMYDTNESLINDRTNEIIRILTMFSVIIFPLTLFAAIWGMNVAVPLENHQAGFWVILTLMMIGVIIMILIFKLKKWI